MLAALADAVGRVADFVRGRFAPPFAAALDFAALPAFLAIFFAGFLDCFRVGFLADVFLVDLFLASFFGTNFFSAFLVFFAIFEVFFEVFLAISACFLRNEAAA